MVPGNWKATCRRMKLEYGLTPWAKINSKWMKGLNIRPETISYIEENSSNLRTLVIEDVLWTWPQGQGKESKSKQTGLRPTKKPLHSTSYWVGGGIGHSSNKGLIPEIYEELTHIYTKQTTQRRNGRGTWTDTSPKKTYKWPTDGYVKRCSASRAIREMQMRYHLTPVRMAVTNETGNNESWTGGGEKEKSPHFHCR